MAQRMRIEFKSRQLFGIRQQRIRYSNKRILMAHASHLDLSNPIGFDAEDCSSFSLAFMGDLHLPANDEDQMKLFHQARDQLKIMTTQDGSTPRIIQLGDLGSYEKGWPGSVKCFQRAHEFIQSFDIPRALVLGNHDLEADEFETDEANLAAWHHQFQQRHYWSSRVGPVTIIGLSTTQFRSNPYSVHEVHINEEQLEFFKATVAAAAAQNRSVIVVTHAPPMGSGLKVVQAVHVKNRCAWLNHSSDPGVFLRVVEKHPNIKLWFSGHFHLSQSYPDSVSIVGGTAFVLTGVIGDHSSRDGHRHSRLLKGTSDGYELYTVDHDANSMRLDLKGSWDLEAGAPEYLTPEDELLCDPSAGWLCSQVDCSIENIAQSTGNTLKDATSLKWFNAGENSMLSLQDGLLVEYDVATMSAIGVVFLDLPDNCTVRLLDAQGNEVDVVNTDGSNAVAVEALDEESGEVVSRVERNSQGGFYQIFQPNKWVARKAKEAAEAARVKAEQQEISVSAV